MPQDDVLKTERQEARARRRRERNIANGRQYRANQHAALEGMAQKVVELETENASLCKAVIFLQAQLDHACATIQANQGPVFNNS